MIKHNKRALNYLATSIYIYKHKTRFENVYVWEFHSRLTCLYNYIPTTSICVCLCMFENSFESLLLETLLLVSLPI